jgi:hypothetical protein
MRRPVLGAFLVSTLLIAVLAPASATATGGRHDRDRHRHHARPARDVPHVIIDTDLSRWWDDASTIGLANVLQQQGEVRILGMVSDVPNHIAVGALDAINTAYGHPNIPLGAVAGSEADTFRHGYTDELVNRLPHSVQDSNDVPNAVALYRHLLSRAPDRSVTIVSLGGYTNLAGLLESPGRHGRPDGRALIIKKVKRLVIMDGLFPNGGPAFTNQRLDLEAAAKVVGNAQQPGWPGPIAWVDGFGGLGTTVGETLCTSAPADNPMRIVYEFLFACGPVGDGNWDAPTFLFAIRDIPNAFTKLGLGGAAVINASGGLSWDDNSPRDRDFYVHVADQEELNARIDQLLPRNAPRACSVTSPTIWSQYAGG